MGAGPVMPPPLVGQAAEASAALDSPAWISTSRCRVFFDAHTPDWTDPHQRGHLGSDPFPVLSDVDPERDIGLIAASGADSVVLFAKCQYGNSYYPTTVGRPHAGLRGRDLLGEQIDVAHRLGLRVINLLLQHVGRRGCGRPSAVGPGAPRAVDQSLAGAVPAQRLPATGARSGGRDRLPLRHRRTVDRHSVRRTVRVRAVPEGLRRPLLRADAPQTGIGPLDRPDPLLPGIGRRLPARATRRAAARPAGRRVRPPTSSPPSMSIR